MLRRRSWVTPDGVAVAFGSAAGRLWLVAQFLAPLGVPVWSVGRGLGVVGRAVPRAPGVGWCGSSAAGRLRLGAQFLAPLTGRLWAGRGVPRVPYGRGVPGNSQVLSTSAGCSPFAVLGCGEQVEAKALYVSRQECGG